MVQIIDGQKIAEQIKGRVAKEIHKLKGPRPNLAIILVGERADSKLYVSLKEREGKKIGVDTHLYRLDADIPEKELLGVIKFLNKDEAIDGILVQLPLPPKFKTDKIIAALDPNKDVDGFHPAHPGYILSPVLASVEACLNSINFIPAGQVATILYNSEIFGRELRELLESKGLKVNLKTKSEEADLLITALGEPEKIKATMIKPGAVIIDIGISQVGGKVLGDVDFKDIKMKAAFITPVPGGIGPMTIAFLFQNVWEIFKRQKLPNI